MNNYILLFDQEKIDSDELHSYFVEKNKKSDLGQDKISSSRNHDEIKYSSVYKEFESINRHIIPNYRIILIESKLVPPLILILKEIYKKPVYSFMVYSELELKKFISGIYNFHTNRFKVANHIDEVSTLEKIESAETILEKRIGFVDVEIVKSLKRANHITSWVEIASYYELDGWDMSNSKFLPVSLYSDIIGVSGYKYQSFILEFMNNLKSIEFILEISKNKESGDAIYWIKCDEHHYGVFAKNFIFSK